MNCRIIITLLSFCIFYGVNAQQSDYAYTAIDFTKVKLTDSFWLPRIQTNRLVTIPASFERCESTGRIKNFVMAAEKKGKFCTTFPFDDTDIYKTIEAASFSLANYSDKRLEAYVDSLIVLIEKAQESDGYLYTARTINPAQPHSWAGLQRWEKERELSHELYNAGHLYEAAVAHYLATKKTSLLNIAIKNANLVCSVFGEGKMIVAPGHQIVEMGLIKLFRVTNQIKYLETARFFIESRGKYTYDVKSKDPWKNGAYWQDHLPVIQQKEAVGHAVRAGYLYAAMADIAALCNDTAISKAIDAIWNNVVEKKIYVQGGLGAIASGERFGDNYELPNASAYNETCAAIAGVYWNQRMFLLHGQSKYIDVLEKILYNGLIAGVGLDGKSFFYTNAMQVKNYHTINGTANGFTDGKVEVTRSGWFDCSCCPTNITRFLPSLAGYLYAQKNESIYANLFANSVAFFNIAGKSLQIQQQNNYPWQGNLLFTMQTKNPLWFKLHIRIPGWAVQQAIPSQLYQFQQKDSTAIVCKVNGKMVTINVENGYAIIERKWMNNDTVELVLPMPVHTISCNNLVRDNIGKVALQRGPLVYCAEWVDNNGKTSNIILPSSTSFSTAFEKNVLNGIQTIQAIVPVINISDKGDAINTKQQIFKAIPYYAWANRGKGEMMIWFPQTIKNIDIISK